MDKLYVVEVEDFSATESNDTDTHTFKVSGVCQTREQARTLLKQETRNCEDSVDEEWEIEEDSPDLFIISDDEFGDFIKVSVTEVPFYHD